MSPYSSLLISAVLTVAGGAAGAGAPLTVTHAGWTVTADGERGVLTVSHERLATVLQNVRLSLRGAARPRADGELVGREEGTRQLLLRTAAPATVWLVEPGPDALRVSSTSTRAVLTAEAPAPADRVVARLLDPRGTPVDWTGTDRGRARIRRERDAQPVLPSSAQPGRDVLRARPGRGLHSPQPLRPEERHRDPLLGRHPDGARSRGTRTASTSRSRCPGTRPCASFPTTTRRPSGSPSTSPSTTRRFRRPPTIWCSWTAYYADVKEEDVVRNADWIAANLEAYGFDYVQLDDGYDRGKNGEHYWIENWDQAKFPHGPQWLAGYVKSKGLRPGLWLVPNAYAGAVEQHPDWYLRDKQGTIIRDYNTPALDSTHPEVLDFLRKLFTTLREWGFEYYKFDGEHALPRYVPARRPDQAPRPERRPDRRLPEAARGHPRDHRPRHVRGGLPGRHAPQRDRVLQLLLRRRRRLQQLAGDVRPLQLDQRQRVLEPHGRLRDAGRGNRRGPADDRGGGGEEAAARASSRPPAPASSPWPGSAPRWPRRGPW